MQKLIVSSWLYFFIIQRSTIGRLQIHHIWLDLLSEFTLCLSLLNQPKLNDRMLPGNGWILRQNIGHSFILANQVTTFCQDNRLYVKL
jgi:hypothetical protein